MSHKVIVIGGGIAGMEASAYLAALGASVTLIEKDEKPGGHLKDWERLFPTHRLGAEVLDFLAKGLSDSVTLLTSTEALSASVKGNGFIVHLSNGQSIEGDAVLISTGYDIFDARKKEEYGYGIYDNVITSAELEAMFLSGKPVVNHQGKKPSRVAFIHCVGSRDAKVGNIYCSKVCCVTAVKQSIEIRQHLPDCEAYCFYMDMRMYGTHFEELYNEAQEKYGVTFIRGRLSEACENQDHSLLLKVEDTLVGRPLRLSVDLIVLMVGFVPSEGTRKIAESLGVNFGPNRFIKPKDEHTLNNCTNIPGVFVAGTSSAPRTITNTIMDARAAAASIISYLNKDKVQHRQNA